jgi:hypothetical protein
MRFFTYIQASEPPEHKLSLRMSAIRAPKEKFVRQPLLLDQMKFRVTSPEPILDCPERKVQATY